jgi:hypothetical protein
MEDLFSTNLDVNKKNVVYKVFFNDEKYTFQPEAKQREFPEFSLRREHDEWHELQLLPPDLKRQAIDVLEKYLLKQH